MASGPANLPVLVLLVGFGDYQVQVVGGIERLLRGRGVPLLAVCADGFASKATPGLVLELVRQRQVRGAIVLPDVVLPSREDLRAAFDESGLPIVTLGAKLPGRPCVSGDDTRGMGELMQHLLDERGVRRPALVRGLSGYPDSVRREEVVRRECARRGIVVDDGLVVDGDFRTDVTYDALHRLLQRRQDFDAVIAFNDTSALGALAALRDHRVRVPEDVVLSGFDDMRLVAEVWPPLTTVDQCLEEQGSAAAELLLRLVAGERGIADVLVPTRLVRRVSTGSGAPTVEQLLPVTLALEASRQVQDRAVGIGIGMGNCRSVEDLTHVVEMCLSHLGIGRSFLAVEPTTTADPGHPDGSDEHRATLAFSYRDGEREPHPEETFPRYRLLPRSLRDELGTGALVVQPLSVEGRERGHLMYDLVAEPSLVSEAMRLELPRAVDTVCSSQELHRLVMLDGLTGIANRKAFEQMLERSCRVEDGQPRRVALLMVDIDEFKAYNDHYGHLAGDAALKAVASCLADSVPATNGLACRYGGEEFTVVLPDRGESGAVAVARRFIRLLGRTAIPHARSQVAPVVTASVGVAATTATAGLDPNDLIKAADDALYQAKLQGRHRFVVAGRSPRVPHQRAGSTPPPPAGERAGTAAVSDRSAVGQEPVGD